VKVADWRKARALLWVGITAITLALLFVLHGDLQIPGLPRGSPAFVASLEPWVFIIPLLIATKALLVVLRPVFRAALKTHVRYEADIFAHFQLVSYAVWATVIGLVFLVMIGGGAQQFGFLGTAFVSAALIYVMQEPLLNLMGWIVLVSMGLYKLGDRIEMNNTRGYVVNISPMNTTLREFGGILYGDTFTGRYVTIPNSQIVKGNVFNYTKDTPFVWDQLTVNVTYESDVKLAEKLIFEAAEEVVGPMMRENRVHLRAKYEFADLADYMAEEPKVGWALGASSIDMNLVYFCPVFAKGSYRTRLVKRIYEKFMAEPRVQFAYPHVQYVPSDAEREKEAARTKERMAVAR